MFLYLVFCIAISPIGHSVIWLKILFPFAYISKFGTMFVSDLYGILNGSAMASTWKYPFGPYAYNLLHLSDITRTVIGQLSAPYSIAGPAKFQSVFPRSIRLPRDNNKYLTKLVFFVRTVSKRTSFSPLRFMARAFCLGHKFEGKKKKLGLQLRVRTGLVRRNVSITNRELKHAAF